MNKIDQITEIITNQSDPEPFSGVVSLTAGEEILYQRVFGQAIRSEQIPNQINTRFQTASGCKIFTSVAVCKLVDEGLLDFNTRLREVVDVDFPHYDPEISVHHLLTHSSGITSYFEEDIDPDYEALWQDTPLYRVRRPADFLPLFQNKPMKFSPGERFEYNDGGYILLGLVIEAVTGRPFTEVVQERVFEPAGMADSGYFAADMLPPRTAYAYIQNPDGAWRTNIFAVPVVGAPDGGAYTTAPDLQKFWGALRGNRLLDAAHTEKLRKPQIATGWDPPYTHYGYGVWIDQADSEIRKIFVEGYDPGVALRSAVYPKTDQTLTLIGNTSGALWPLYEALETHLGL